MEGCGLAVCLGIADWLVCGAVCLGIADWLVVCGAVCLGIADWLVVCGAVCFEPEVDVGVARSCDDFLDWETDERRIRFAQGGSRGGEYG